MGKKILVTSTLLFFLPLVCLKGVEIQKNQNKKHIEAKEVALDDGVYKEDVLKHGQAKMTTEDGITTYYCRDTATNFKRFQNVSMADKLELDKKDLVFAVESYDDVGLVDLDYKVVDKLTQTVEVEGKFNGYVVDTPNGKKDIMIDILDYSVSARELAEGRVSKDIIVIADPGVGGGGGTGTGEALGSLATIALNVTSDSGATSIANNHISAPGFNPTNLTPFLFYHAVIENAKRHYKANKAQESVAFPRNAYGYIVNQNDPAFLNYKYGFWNSNINKSGCPIISVYNAMRFCGQTPNFSALIMTYELCYADFGFGHLGAMPYSLNAVERVALSNALTAIYSGIVQPILNLVASTIVLPALYLAIPIPLVPESIYASLMVTINNVNGCVSKLIDFYLARIHSEGEMLRIFFASNQVKETTSFSTFKNYMKTRRQGVICFWNTWENGSIKLGDGAHYIFFSKSNVSGVYKFKTYNACQDGQTDITINNLAKLMGDWSNNYNQGQFIAGYALGN